MSDGRDTPAPGEPADERAAALAGLARGAKARVAKAAAWAEERKVKTPPAGTKTRAAALAHRLVDVQAAVRRRLKLGAAPGAAMEAGGAGTASSDVGEGQDSEPVEGEAESQTDDQVNNQANDEVQGNAISDDEFSQAAEGWSAEFPAPFLPELRSGLSGSDEESQERHFEPRAEMAENACAEPAAPEASASSSVDPTVEAELDEVWAQLVLQQESQAEP